MIQRLSEKNSGSRFFQQTPDQIADKTTMCGRFTLTQPNKVSEAFFNVCLSPLPPPRFNIAPQQPISVVCQIEREKQARLMLWGLIPSWAKDDSWSRKLINARSETAAEKPSFRSAFRYRRCLIPVDGFYEWKTTPQGKHPYYFLKPGRSLFALAGLWEVWNDIETVTILTTQANGVMKPIHARMPVILQPSDYEAWLNPFSPWQEMQTLMKPYRDQDLQRYRVSDQVNRPSYDQPSCITPISNEANETLD